MYIWCEHAPTPTLRPPYKAASRVVTPIRAVAFDFDGTLYPNTIMYMRSLHFS